MKVLVIAFNDSDNIMIENILLTLKNRNHFLRIFAHLIDKKSIGMFEKLNCPIKRLNEIKSSDLEWADCIFKAHVLVDFNFFKLGAISNKYTYLYVPYIENHWHTSGGDFMFTCGRLRHPSYTEDCASMPIGCPKNDHILLKETIENYKMFLFIDSGHFPFSHKGKLQIAEMLLKICEKYPEYKLVVKPRFLFTDKNMNHANFDHIYTIIEQKCGGNLPDNLILLNEHVNLQDLLDQCSCAIMLCTSAYIDVALRHKNMIIIKGIDNEDKYDLRNEIEYRNIYELREKSGCVVDYNNVFDYLPNGLVCERQHIDEIVAYRENSSEKIVQVMEHVYDKFLSKGLFPQIKSYKYETYRTEMFADESLSWNEIKRKRIKNIGICKLNMFNRVVADINYSALIYLIENEYKNYPLSVEGIQKYINDYDKTFWDILTKNKEKLMLNDLDQEQYIYALFKLRKYNQILYLPAESIICIGAWNYYIGIIYYQDGLFEDSKDHLIAFVKEARTRFFAKYCCEEFWGINDAICKLIDMHNRYNQKMSKEEFLEIYLLICEKQMENVIPYKEKKTLWNISLEVSKELIQNKEYYLASQILEKYISGISRFNEEKKRIDQLNVEIRHIKQSFSYRIGFALTLIPRKLRKCIRSIREKGLQYPYNEVKIKINNTLLYKMSHEFKLNILKGYKLYEDIIKRYGGDCYIELGALGTGNIYICGLYYREYIRAKKRVGTDIYLLPENNCLDVARMFPMSDRNQLINSEQYFELISLVRYMGEPSVRIDYLYYHNLKAQYTGILTWIEGIKGWNMKTVYDAVFFDNISMSKENGTQWNSESSEDLFVRNELIKGKTVILSPYAGTMRKLPYTFWIRLVKALQKEEYCICTNVAGDNELPIEGTIGVFCPYAKMISFVENAGYFVGLRSGLLDIIESANCRKVGLYTSIIQSRGFAGKSGLLSFSLNEMFQRYDWLELETKPSNLNEVIDEILEYFEK